MEPAPSLLALVPHVPGAPRGAALLLGHGDEALVRHLGVTVTFVACSDAGEALRRVGGQAVGDARGRPVSGGVEQVIWGKNQNI